MSDIIPIGFEFCPLDSELVVHYLYNKVVGNPLPYEGMVTDCDLYGKREPWEIFEASGSNKNVGYFFTKLKKKSSNGSRIDRTVGSGTWKGQDSGSDVVDPEKRCIGRKKMLVFDNKGSANNKTHYIMHEFSLAGYLLQQTKCDDIVLCRIRKKEDNKKKNDDMVINIEDNQVQHFTPPLIIEPNESFTFEKLWALTERDQQQEDVFYEIEENRNVAPEKVEHFSDLIKIDQHEGLRINEEILPEIKSDYQQNEHNNIGAWTQFNDIYDQMNTDTENDDFNLTDWANNLANELLQQNQEEPIQKHGIDMISNMQLPGQLGN